MASEFTHRDGDVRVTVKASTMDWTVYAEWVAETIREVRSTRTFLFWSYDHWERSGTPLPIAAFFQTDQSVPPAPGFGNPIGPVTSEPNGDPGYRVVRLWQVGLGISAGSDGDWGLGAPGGSVDGTIVGSIEALRVEFPFDGKTRVVETGANWITKVISIGVLFLIALALAPLVASLLAL